jgi:hydroxymethylbilane synthase
VLSLRLGTRKSALALAQSGQVARALEACHPGTRIELVTFVTTGDRTLGDLAEVGGKGLFTEELERGLVDGSLDLAVHSLKDLPVRLPPGLGVAAYPKRADPRDALISEVATSLQELPRGAMVLTGSLRRRALVLRHRPDLRVEPLRGNVDTRVRKWRESGAAGLILAAAGLDRLGLGLPDGDKTTGDLPIHRLDPETFVPAPGQGTLAMEAASEGEAFHLCAALDDPASRLASVAERAVVEAFGADCTLPLAAWCREEDGELRLSVFLSTPQGDRWVEDEVAGATAEETSEKAIDSLRRQGAQEILDARSS